MDLSKIVPISAESFVFGPKQTAWLEALESGNYKQTQRQLMAERHSAKDGPHRAYCCLGVLCEVAGLEFVPHSPELAEYGYKWGDIKTNGYLPGGFEESVGLRTTKGGFKEGVNLSRGAVLSDTYYSLAELNDGGGLIFADIAAYIRHDPHNVFTKSA